MTTADRVRRIMVQAEAAAEAERRAIAATGDEVCATFWQDYDQACASLLGLILSPEGRATFIQINTVFSNAELVIGEAA